MITGATGVVTDIPRDPERNTAGRALLAMQEALKPGLRLRRRPSTRAFRSARGLGGSAASAVAAVVAANALLDKPLGKIELLQFAMQGEKVSSGSLHVDNISPSLFGGLVLTVGIDHPRVKQIPVPPGIRAVLVHPHLFLSTKAARGILKREVTMSDFIWQTANLAGFISGCYTNDLDMIRASFEDVVIEKQRSQLIPGFDAVRQGAIDNGALGCTISGAGPTMFAWALEADAQKVRDAMVAAFKAAGKDTDDWVVPITTTGAHVVRHEIHQHARLGSRRQFRRRADPGSRTRRRSLHARDLAGDSAVRFRRRARRLPEVATVMLQPFVAGDAIADEIADIARDAFNFPGAAGARDRRRQVVGARAVPWPDRGVQGFRRALPGGVHATAAEGCGAPAEHPGRHLGDTGGAVAAAFHRRPGVVVSVLFPKGLVSPTQERQLTCWGDNVHSYRVNGSFDDCQRLVKEAFVDPGLKAAFELSSANSINLGRLLPQAVYYAATSLAMHRKHGVKPNFVIPSGNLGNSVACVLARKIGLPIGRIVLAHNVNRAVPDFLQSGEWQPRASIPTLASAMDVGAPSNMERLRALFPDLESVRGAVRAESVTDEQIKARIAGDFGVNTGNPGARIRPPRPKSRRECPLTERADGRWVLVSTAHPAKFREIVEPLIGERIAMPESLAKLFERPVSCADLEPELRALSGALQKT